MIFFQDKQVIKSFNLTFQKEIVIFLKPKKNYFN